jgi:uncharacterized membrane protein YgcG
MRCTRLLGVVLASLAAAVLVAPRAVADPPLRLPDYVTDKAGVLTQGQRVQVETAVNDLYNSRRIRLWVVYVDDFSGQDPGSWAQTTYRTSNLGAYDAILAVATVDRAYAFEVPTTVKNVRARSTICGATRSSPPYAAATGAQPRWRPRTA